MPGFITRIKNNQITDSTITDAKISSYTLTGGKLANNLTYSSNLTVTGNLIVNGTTTTVDTVNTLISDPLLVLSRNAVGTPSVDSGLIIERGSSQNATFIWDETNDRFLMGLTTDDGSTAGTISIASLATLRVGVLSAESNVSVANIVISGNSILSASGTNGNINLDPDGAGDVIITSGNLRVSALTSGRMTFAGTLGTLVDSDNLTYNSGTNTFTVTGTAIAGNLSLSGNTLTSTNTNANVNINPNGTGNIVLGDSNSPTVISATSAATSTTSGALTVSGGLGVSGNVYATAFYGNGSALTGVTATEFAGGTITNATTFSNTAPSTSTTSGAVVVTGGVGVGGNVHALAFFGNGAGLSGIVAGSFTGGSVPNVTTFSNSAVSTSTTSGALIVTGGTGIGGDLNVGGNITITQNLIVKGTTTTVNSTTTQVVDPIFQIGGGVDGGSLVADDNKDRGIAFKWHDGAAERTGFFGYDDSTGKFIFVPNATISSEVVSGSLGNLDFGGASFSDSIASTSTATGTVIVTGGAGIGGNINVGGAQSKFTSGTASTSTASGALQVTGGVGVSGNVYATAFYGNGAALTGVVASEFAGGNITNATTFSNAAASTSTTSGALVVTGGTGIGGNLYVGGLASVAGNVFAGNVSGATLTGNVNSSGTSSFSTATFSTLANVTSTTASTNTTTGALRVAGGAGIVGNLYASNLYISDNTLGSTNTNANIVVQPNGTGFTIINSSAANSDTIIRGDTDNNLIYVDASADNVGIGTNAPNAGSKLHISATNSMIIPVGNTAQRPGTPATGMVRFNSTLNDLEFWNGTEWKVASQDFTIVASDVFSGDGTTTAFTLSTSQTTNSCIVTINGVVQMPVVAYGVTGTTLTFTEAPATGDEIEVRKLTTTNSTVFNGGTVTGATTFSANVTSTSKTTGTVIITGGLGVSGNIYAGGSVNQNADLAENYLADAAYAPGTVLEFGGANEVTIAEDETRRVAGVVSTSPGYLMNSGLVGPTVVPVAFVGRVPTKVRGTIRKGDLMVSGGGGFARPTNDPKVGTILGKALEDFNGVEGVIEVAVNLS